MIQLVYSPNYFPQSIFYQRSLVSLSFFPHHINISVNDVSCELTRFCNNKSIRSGGLLTFCTISKITIFSPILLFQKSLNEGIFSSILKLESITLISKTGDPTNIFNYHPITILCHIAILFETLMLNILSLQWTIFWLMNNMDSDQGDKQLLVI